MNETTFRKKKLIERLEREYPGAIILRTDPSDINSICDRIMLYGNQWAAFETKRAFNSTRRPNQDYYVNLLDDMSFARFVYPENIEEVFRDLEYALRP